MTKPDLKVIELHPERTVTDPHREHLQTSGLTDETIKLAGLYTEVAGAGVWKLMGWKYPQLCGNVIVFPFFEPGEEKPFFFRIRPSRPRKRPDGSVAKYDQRRDAGFWPYFGPRTRTSGKLADPIVPLVFTEGEKKTLLIDQLGYAVVGLNGVDCAHDKAAKDAGEGLRLHPMILKHTKLAGRACTVCFDADARDNDKVMLAARKLAGMLLGAGALSVRLACPPGPEKKSGIDDFHQVAGEIAARHVLDNGVELEPISPKDPLVTLRGFRALSHAPIEKDLRLPDGYELRHDGSIWREGTDEKKAAVRVARSPILIRRYLDDLYTGETRVEITFPRKRAWHRHVVDRVAIADRSRMIAELSPLSAPVTSNTAAGLVDWFEALEHTNEDRFERAVCVGRAGWHQVNGVRMFALGEPIVAEGQDLAEPIMIDDRGDRRKTFAALRPRGGSLEQHIAALRGAWEASPIAAAVICASFAAPLLEVLDAPNFALHLPGDSSRGKTSMLKIAASVWGDPSNDQWVASWNTTSVGAELRASSLSGLPLCFDEVGASDVQMTERLVYMLINGGGRARGQKDLQLRETPTWKTVVLSTGERQLAGEDAATGAQVRVLQFHVANFGPLDAAKVDAIRDAACDNFGHAGREWILELLATPDWDELRRQHKAGVANYRAAARNPLQQRQASYFALLALVETLLFQRFGLGGKDGDTIGKLMVGADAHARTESLAVRARTRVLDWWHSQPGSFPELAPNTAGADSARPERGERVINGYYRAASTRADERLLLIPGRLREFLKENNMSSPEVVAGWLELGWLQPHQHHGKQDGTCTISVNGHKQRLIALSVSDIDAEPAESPGGDFASA